MKTERMGPESFIDIVSANRNILDNEIPDVTYRISDAEWLSACPVHGSVESRTAFRSIISSMSSSGTTFSSAFSDLSRYLFVFSPAYRSAISGDSGLGEQIKTVIDKYSNDPDADILENVKYISEFVFDYGYTSAPELSGTAAASDENKTSWTAKVKSSISSIIMGSSRYAEFNECISELSKKSQKLADMYIEWKSDADSNFAWITIGQRIAIGLKYRNRRVPGVGIDAVGRIVGQAVGTETQEYTDTSAKIVPASGIFKTINLRKPGSVYVTAEQTVTLMSANAEKFISRGITNINDVTARETVRRSFMHCMYYVLSGSEYHSLSNDTLRGSVSDILKSMSILSPNDAIAHRNEFVSRVTDFMNMDSTNSLMTGLLDASGEGFSDLGKSVMNLLNRFFKIGGNTVTVGDLVIENTSADINYADTLNKASSGRERVELGYINAEAASRLNDAESGHGRGGVIQMDNGRVQVTVQGVNRYMNIDPDDSFKLADELDSFTFPFVIGSIYRDGCPAYTIGYGLRVFEKVTASGYSEGDLSTSSGNRDYSETAREITSVFSDGTSAKKAVENKHGYDALISKSNVSRIISHVFSDKQDFLNFVVCLSMASYLIRKNFKSIAHPLNDIIKNKIGLFHLHVRLLSLVLPMISAPDAQDARKIAMRNFRTYLDESLAKAGVSKASSAYVAMLPFIENELNAIYEKLGNVADEVYSKCEPYMRNGDSSSRSAIYLAASNYPGHESDNTDVMNTINIADYAQINYVPAKYICEDEFGTISKDDFDTSMSAIYKYISKDSRETSDEDIDSTVSIDNLSTEDIVTPSEGQHAYKGLGLDSGSAPYSSTLKRIGQVGEMLDKKVNPIIYNTISMMLNSADKSMAPLKKAFDPDTRYAASVYMKFREKLSDLMSKNDYKGASELCKTFSSGDMFFSEDNAVQAISLIQEYCESDTPVVYIKRIEHLLGKVARYANESENGSDYAGFADDAMKKLEAGDYDGIAKSCEAVAGDKIGTLSNWNPVSRMYPEKVDLGKVSSRGDNSVGAGLADYFNAVYFPDTFDTSANARGNDLCNVLAGCVSSSASVHNFIEAVGRLAYERHSEDNSDYLSGALSAPTAYPIGKFVGRVISYISNNYVPGININASNSDKSYYIVADDDRINKGELFETVRTIFLDVISGNTSAAMGIIKSEILPRIDEYPMFVGMSDSEILSKIIYDVTGARFTGNVNDLITTLFDYRSDAGKLNADTAQVTWGNAVNAAVRNSVDKKDNTPDVIPSYARDTMIDPMDVRRGLMSTINRVRSYVVSVYEKHGLPIDDSTLDNRKTVSTEYKKRAADNAPKDVLASLKLLLVKMGDVVGFSRGSGTASVDDFESSPSQARKKFKENRFGLNSMLKGELNTVPDTNTGYIRETLDGIISNLSKDSVIAGGMLHAGGGVFDDGDDFANAVKIAFGNRVQRMVTAALSAFVEFYVNGISSDDGLPSDYTLPFSVMNPDQEDSDLIKLYGYDGKRYNKFDLINRMFADYCGNGIGGTKFNMGKSIKECVSEAAELSMKISARNTAELGGDAAHDVTDAAEKSATSFASKCSAFLPNSLYIALGTDEVILASSKIIRDSFSSEALETDQALAETYLDYVQSRVDSMMTSANTGRLDADTVAAYVKSYIQPSERPFKLTADTGEIADAIRRIHNSIVGNHSNTVPESTASAIWSALAAMLKSDFPFINDDILNHTGGSEDLHYKLTNAVNARIAAVGQAMVKMMAGSAVKKCSDDLISMSAKKKEPVIHITESDRRMLETDMKFYLPAVDPIKLFKTFDVHIVNMVKQSVADTVFGSDEVPYAVSCEVWYILMRYLRVVFPDSDISDLGSVPSMYA